MATTHTVNASQSEVNGEQSDREAPQPGKRSRGSGRHPAPSPVGNKSYSEVYSSLGVTERKFVRLALRDGDVDSASRICGYTNSYDVLGRASVRSALLLAAPFTESHITARLSKPYVIQALLRGALNGDVAASKVLLSLDVKPSLPVTYTRGVRSPGVTSTESQYTESPSTPGPSTYGASTASE